MRERKMFQKRRNVGGIFRKEEDGVGRSQIAGSSNTNKDNNNVQKCKCDLSQKENVLGDSSI